MPTESDFLSAADMLGRAGISVHAIPNSVSSAFGSHVTIGGQLTLDINSLLMTTQVTCARDGEELNSLAVLCRERAAMVAAYAAALEVYTGRMQSYEWTADRWQRNYSNFVQDPSGFGHPGPRPSMPVRPQKPAPWMEL